MAEFIVSSHYPWLLQFAIRGISMGVDHQQVKDSLTLLSLAVRPWPAACILQLPPLFPSLGGLSATNVLLKRMRLKMGELFGH